MNEIKELCPYCLKESLDSDDHIFSQFLGGKRTIPSGKKCNNNFGGDFEGRISKDFTPIFITLSRHGYTHPRRVVFQRAFKNAEGVEWDVSSDGEIFPSDPLVKDGKKRTLHLRDEKEAKKHIRSIKAKKGEDFPVNVFHSVEQIPLPAEWSFGFKIDDDIKRLAVKMCIGLGQHLAKERHFASEDCKQFLLNETHLAFPILMMYSRYSYTQLDAIRPPLSHVIYIEANSETSNCYGVVQFFGGALQFYIPLNTNYVGADFSAIGILNIITLEETFNIIEPLRLQAPPQFINGIAKEQLEAETNAHLNEQIKAAFPKKSNAS